MGTSPDVGGRAGIGRPLVPEHSELETTAQTRNFKLGLGIVPNSIDLSFTQIGEETTWKYQASPSKPSVPMDVLKGIQRPDVEQKSQLEEEHFQSLLEDLPLNLSMELKKQRKLPYADRDSAYVVFEEVLRFAAKALAWLEEAAAIDPEAHVEKASVFQGIPKALFHRWILAAESGLKELAILQASGIDLTLAATCKDNIEWVMKTISKAKAVVKAKDKKATKNALEALHEFLEDFSRAFRQKKLTTVMQWTGALLHALLTPVAALSSDVKHPAHLLCLSLSIDHLYNQNNKRRPFKEGFRSIIDELKNTLSSKEKPYSPFLVPCIYFQTLLFSSLVLEAGGIAFSFSQEEGSPKRDRLFEARSLGFTLAIALITSSNAIPEIAAKLFNAFPLKKTTKNAWKKVSVALAYHHLILAGDKGDKATQKVTPIILGMKPALINELVSAKKILTQAPKSKEGMELGKAIRHALLAIKKGELTGYLDPIYGWLKKQHIGKKQIQFECEAAAHIGLIMLTNYHKLSELTNFTSVVSQAA